LEARSAAVQGIEKSINEIGQIFQQLTHMIAEQGETVQRIDANIEDVGFNIERGHLELIKYYKYVSSNRWLLLKMFMVLIVFMVIFNAFFL
jgi:syntaxin 5